MAGGGQQLGGHPHSQDSSTFTYFSLLTYGTQGTSQSKFQSSHFSSQGSSLHPKDLLTGGVLQCIEAASVGMPFEVFIL